MYEWRYGRKDGYVLYEYEQIFKFNHNSGTSGAISTKIGVRMAYDPGTKTIPYTPRGGCRKVVTFKNLNRRAVA